MKKLLFLLLLTPVSLHLTACSTTAQTISDRDQAIEILEEVPLIDGHNDAPWQYHSRAGHKLSLIDFMDTSGLGPAMHTDITRLREGRVGGQFWSVYVSPAQSESEAVQGTLEQIDFVHRMIESRPDHFELALTAGDLTRIFGAGRIASLIGVEGGHSIGNSLGVLRQFHQLGARYMTLTHSTTLDWADSSTDTPRHGGLSAFGEEVVAEMNRLGMMVDLSHVSPGTMRDAIRVSESPVVFTHSSARGLADHSRNVPDDVMEMVRENGGVIMVTYVPTFVSEEARQHLARESAEEARLESIWRGQPEEVSARLEAWMVANPAPEVTLADVADHIDYIRDLIGVDHIGIGADYDGITSLPAGLEDVSTYPDLFAELLRRGYGEEDLKKIAGLNILRVMRENEQVAERLQQERGPSEALIGDFD